MRLEEVEGGILNEVRELLSSCKGFCRDEREEDVLRLREETLYEGCEYCIIRTYFDAIGLPTYSIQTSGGKYIEYTILEEHVAEVGEDFIQFIRIDNFSEHVDDLVEFGIISAETAEELVKWVLDRRGKRF
ncbi:MAG: hypothetical protein QXS42_05450 [Zestosphaera sp.]